MTVEPAATGEIMPEATLVDCEQALAAVERVASIQKGVIYRHIRDNRLYRERDYATFEGYCQSEYGLSARHVNRLIEAADVVEELGPIGPIQNESQARAIAPVLRDHGPGVAAEVLREAASDGKVTARSISEVAERVYRPTQPAKPETVVPTVVEDEPVEVLTSEEWHDANGFEQISTDPDPDDFLPAQSKFERGFWQHLRQAQELAKDLDYPQHFTEPMTQMVSDVIETLSRKHTNVAGRGLRVVNGGKA